eukprot:scaffold2340_cov113-Isochrysis_galbana.AAC.1
MAAKQLLNLTATLGPFGLAFPAEPLSVQRLSCDQIRGRPFITGVHVSRLLAPIGTRDVYEFRVACGAASTRWSELGPSTLVWASSITAEANCPRPQSASGLLVTRAREDSPWWRAWSGGGHDHYAFGLLCGEQHSSVELLETRGSVEEQQTRRCPAGSFVSAIEVWRGFEPAGSYDLFEFRLDCSQMVDAFDGRGAASEASAGGAAGGAAQAGVDRPVRSDEPGSQRHVPAGMAARRGGGRGTPLVGSRGGEADEGPPAAGSRGQAAPSPGPGASGTAGQPTGAAAGAAAAFTTGAGQSTEGGASAGARDGASSAGGPDVRPSREAAREARRAQEEMETLLALLKHRRESRAKADDADAADVFGRVRETADD